MDTDSELKYNEDRDDMSVDQISKPIIFSRADSEQNWNQSMQKFQIKKEKKNKQYKKQNTLTQKEFEFFNKHFQNQSNSIGNKNTDPDLKTNFGIKKPSFQRQGTFTNYQGHQEMPIVSTPTQKRRNFDFNNSIDDLFIINGKIFPNSKNDQNDFLKSQDNVAHVDDANKNFLRANSIFQCDKKDVFTLNKTSQRQQYLPKNTGDTCYENLHSLYNCLLKLFQGQNPSSDMKNLQDHEKEIFQAIVQRKFNFMLSMSLDQYQLQNELEKIQNQESNKRPEENYKFIFKKCLKSMKQKLRKKMKSKRKIKKKDQEKFFYNYYFKEISEREQIPLEHFFHPKNSKAQKTYKSQNVPKTINMYYVENIKKSKEFVHDFCQYLQNNLVSDYQDQVKSKIESLISKWNERINDLSSIEQAVEEIKRYILENKKCKLPWSYREIESAIESVKSLFNQPHLATK